MVDRRWRVVRFVDCCSMGLDRGRGGRVVEEVDAVAVPNKYQSSSRGNNERTHSSALS
jgi:hypothetical protein